MSSVYGGYEYFSGANVTVSLENFPVSEAVGISAKVQESKTPQYGYSSRFFDAVSRGRVLVVGSIVMNYVHQDYLYHLISLALQDQDPRSVLGATTQEDSLLRDSLNSPEQQQAIAAAYYSNYFDNQALSDEFKNKFWDNPGSSVGADSPAVYLPNPHDSFGGLTIDVKFGEQSARTSFMGYTAFRLHDVYFLGRGTSIQIDEQVIVEEYNFFARNISNIPVQYAVVPASVSDDHDQPSIDQTYTTVAIGK